MQKHMFFICYRLYTGYDNHFFDAVAVRAALLFHYYSDEELKKAFSNYEVIKRETDRRGNRHLIIKL